MINDRGKILACQITPGNVDDHKPIPALCKRLFGKLIETDRRSWLYLSVFIRAVARNFQRATHHTHKKNVKNRLMPMIDKILLRKRAIIESVMDQIKNISQIEYTRHRSPINAFVNIIARRLYIIHVI